MEQMNHGDIIEAAARALCDARNMPWEQSNPGSRRFYHDLALSVVPAVAPLIRAAALEEAAQNFERYETEIGSGVAAAIRAWKEQP
jgi:hypothetical protein